LRVGGVGSTQVRAFLPFKSKPPQVFEHGINEFRFAPRIVQIFITQHKHTSMSADTLLRGPECSGMTKM